MEIKDLVLLIQALKGSGVSKFVLNDLSIEFVSHHSAPSQWQPSYDSCPQEQIREQSSSVARSEVDLREEQLAQLILEDPVAYEKFMMSGDVELEEHR